MNRVFANLAFSFSGNFVASKFKKFNPAYDTHKGPFAHL
jgi:hypothetical protein